MNNQDKRDIFEVGIAFAVFLITVTMGWTLLDSQDKLKEAREDKCPQSHNVYVNGEYVGCTDNSTKYNGWYPGIENDRDAEPPAL